MRTKLIMAGLLIAATLPGAALAQPYDPACVQSNQDNRAAGTVIGAVGGALLGGAIAASNDHPCPAGYDYGPPSGPGYWNGAPQGIHARIDFMQDRISQAASDERISPQEADRENRELAYIRSE